MADGEKRLYIREMVDHRSVLVYEMVNTPKTRPDRFAIRINEYGLPRGTRWHGGKVTMFLEEDEVFARAFRWLYLGEVTEERKHHG